MSRQFTISDVTGQRFGKLTVLRRNGHIGKARAWICVCDCGNEVTRETSALIRCKSPDCGCMRASKAKASATKHGHSRNKEHVVWKSMIHRCHSPNNTAYDRYGARGIIVCDRWRNSFEAFVEDMGHRPYEKATIERIDNNLGYGPDNCRWASKQEQAINKRNNIVLEFNGESKTVSEWAKSVGIKAATIRFRVHSGWTAEEALTTPALIYKK
jgi:hypothetical protein